MKAYLRLENDNGEVIRSEEVVAFRGDHEMSKVEQMFDLLADTIKVFVGDSIKQGRKADKRATKH